MQSLEYISNQITKAEWQGWLDVIDYPSAERCRSLLLEIRKFCDENGQVKSPDKNPRLASGPNIGA